MNTNTRITLIFSIAVLVMITAVLFVILKYVNNAEEAQGSNKVVDEQGNVTYSFEYEPADAEEIEAISDPKLVNEEALERVHERSEKRFEKSFADSEMGTFDENLKRCVEERSDKSERECLKTLYSSLIENDGGIGSKPGDSKNITPEGVPTPNEEPKQEEQAQPGEPLPGEPAPIQPVVETSN